MNAQEYTPAFIISSTGTIKNMSNNSMTVIFSSSSNCLNIQNGTAVLANERGTGIFAANCEVDIKFNTLGIKIYPNPVATISKIKFLKSPPLTDIFSISIWSANGLKVTSGKANGYELFQGKSLDLSGLHAGTFILQIESDKYKDAIKFIKTL